MKNDRLVVAIGVFKLVKAVILVVAGLGAINLLHGGQARELVQWAALSPGSKHVQHLASKIGVLSEKQLAGIAFGTFLYAASFLVEGVGLILRKHWAEWLTAIITASFIPLEIYELAKEAGAGKIVTLALNVAIVVYLVARIVKRRRDA